MLPESGFMLFIQIRNRVLNLEYLTEIVDRPETTGNLEC